MDSSIDLVISDPNVFVDSKFQSSRRKTIIQASSPKKQGKKEEEDARALVFDWMVKYVIRMEQMLSLFYSLLLKIILGVKAALM